MFDEREGRGPLQGIAAGLAAIGDRASAAFVSAVDVPFLHPAFVRRVSASLDGEHDAVAPELGGRLQPLSSVYRVTVRAEIDALLAADRLRATGLLERCRTLRLDRSALLSDPALAAADPRLQSVGNLDAPADYALALTAPAPLVSVRVGAAEARAVSAWTVGEAATAAGRALDPDVTVALNEDRVVPDPQLPLAAGDRIAFDDR